MLLYVCAVAAECDSCFNISIGRRGDVQRLAHAGEPDYVENRAEWVSCIDIHREGGL